MSITPDGGVTVQCAGGNGGPPVIPVTVDNTIPGTFTMSNAAMTATVGNSASVVVNRTLGGLPYTIYYVRAGSGCVGTTGALAVAGGQLSATIPTPVSAVGTCTVDLDVEAPGARAEPTQTVITVSAPIINGPPPAGCPTGFVTPDNLLTNTFAGLGNPLLQMQASGQIVALTMPNLNGLASGQVTFGESAGGAYTPQPVTLEVSISKCAGLIDTNYANACNMRSTNGNYNSMSYLVKSVQLGRGGAFDANNLPTGYCWAGDNAQYYVNARWSYQTCAFGAQVCGFAIQYNQAAY
jgi:hypothetical protein